MGGRALSERFGGVDLSTSASVNLGTVEAGSSFLSDLGAAYHAHAVANGLIVTPAVEAVTGVEAVAGRAATDASFTYNGDNPRLAGNGMTPTEGDYYTVEGTSNSFVYYSGAWTFANSPERVNNLGSTTATTAAGVHAEFTGASTASEYYNVADIALNAVDLGKLDSALDQAYNDGYADGYADGYVDGFNDGVASVTSGS